MQIFLHRQCGVSTFVLKAELSSEIRLKFCIASVDAKKISRKNLIGAVDLLIGTTGRPIIVFENVVSCNPPVRPSGARMRVRSVAAKSDSLVPGIGR
jgi:hypothetical protein